LKEEDWYRFEQLLFDYRLLQMGYWLKNPTNVASHHLLGGYALFQQGIPEDFLVKQSMMFLQIGSDANAAMGWGDGGELTFCLDPVALRAGRFERIWVEYQCG
jgi:uncharacterized protein YwqG